MITQLIQVLDVAVADLANYKLRLSTACIWALTWLDASLLLLSGQGRDGDAWR
jgi:hypothetical protein